jgi:hypothetical protein
LPKPGLSFRSRRSADCIIAMNEVPPKSSYL